MKKFTKAGLITSGIIFVIGIICCLISWMSGARYNDILVDIPGIGINCNADELGFSVDNKIINKGESLDEPIELDKAMNLLMDVGGAEVIVKKSDDGKFFAESEGINMTWNINNDDIVVQTERRKFLWHIKKSVGKITIYIPEDYEFKNIEIDCGAGVIQIEDVKAESIDLDIGAGEVVAEDIDTKELSIECGAGSIEVSGSVKGNAEIECSMGSVDLEVKQEEKYYNYEIECSMGEVNINDSSYAGMGVEKSIDNDSEYDMSVDCSMGEINIITN
ncbi:MAG: DUF4097 domain-containing protein [Lachnospiraceae bacterium]|nr:DUF4097 domain-containing protein [Lachnospiraceae bacterium]MDE6252788.1 DUF4097 domain-containing protein [Lachnospiraceae bacterium]